MAKKKVKLNPKVAQSPESKNSDSSITSSSSASMVNSDGEMLYQKRHFMTILLGIGLMTVGYIAMSGGSMPDSNTWDESLIYGWRRTVLAPILILAGLGVEVYAVFKK
jgi:hypothetical protein